MKDEIGNKNGGRSKVVEHMAIPFWFEGRLGIEAQRYRVRFHRRTSLQQERSASSLQSQSSSTTANPSLNHSSFSSTSTRHGPNTPGKKPGNASGLNLAMTGLINQFSILHAASSIHMESICHPGKRTRGSLTGEPEIRGGRARGKEILRIGLADLAFGWLANLIGVLQQLTGLKLIDQRFPLLSAWIQEFSETQIIKDNWPSHDKLLVMYQALYDKFHPLK
ncbi:hypothetical protein GQ457_11G006100 [Hibiscus cannabinus]